MPDVEDSLLLLRVRSAANQAKAGLLDLEVEAQLNYRGIYLAGKTQLDLAQLTRALNEAGNRYGRLLGQAICDSRAVEDALRDAKRPERLRVQLMTQDCEDLPLIYWERMELPGWFGPLGANAATPFSRFAAVNQGLEDPPEDKVFDLLLVRACPSSEANEIRPIEDEHCVAVIEACGELLKAGLMTITLLPGAKGLGADARRRVETYGVNVIPKAATAENISELLTDKRHALQLIAHGTYSSTNGFYLLLENEQGGLAARKGSDVINCWNIAQLRLMFLESCQSAIEARDPRPHMHGFMQQLVSAGLPGVVAMQDSIVMEDARTFVKGFYTRLLFDGSVDEAANNGRRLLLEKPGNAWAIPAVMTRLKGGAVWRESLLRGAQRALDRQIRERHDRQGFPRFPLDAIAVSSTAISKHAGERENEDVVKIPPGEHARRALYLDLYEALRGDQKIICILGPQGSGKTRVLEDVYLSEWQNHMEEEQKAVPVLLRLADCAHSLEASETVVANAVISSFGEAAAAINPEELVSLFHKQAFLFLIGADDGVGEAEQQRGLLLLKQFRDILDTQWPDNRHRYIITLEQDALRVAELPESSHCLFIQPMSAERISRYLQATTDKDTYETRLKVLDKLRASSLFDLAETPWLLAEMLGQARRGVLDKDKSGRAAILRRICNERIAQCAGPSGTRTRVEEVLYRLAWELHSRRAANLTGHEIYDILAELRGNRDYSLVDFRTQLVDSSNIMSSCGEDGMRFSYPFFQAYCCARYILRQSDDDRDRLLTDITATLGRRSRVEWWSETLYIVAGLWPDTRKLLSMILSGSALHEGDQIYIAARCLHEGRLAFGAHGSEDPIVRSIVSALIQCSHPASGNSTVARIKALEYLAPLREPAALPHLVSVVLKKMRPSKDEGLRYEASGARLAAIKALLYIQTETISYLEDAPEWADNQALLRTVNHWVRLDSAKLNEDLQLDDELCASVAAFALGLLKPTSALASLAKRFFDNRSEGELLWALADSMLELGDQDFSGVIDQCLERPDRRIFGVYLIGKLGKLGTGAPAAERLAFLKHWAKYATAASGPLDQRRLEGRCLLTLAELRETDILDRCHDALAGEDGTIRYYAMLALRHIGDERSLAKLEALSFPLEDWANNRVLERLRLEVYEDLYWRLSGGLSREIMIPVPPSKQQSTARQAAAR